MTLIGGFRLDSVRPNLFAEGHLVPAPLSRQQKTRQLAGFLMLLNQWLSVVRQFLRHEIALAEELDSGQEGVIRLDRHYTDENQYRDRRH